MTTRSSLRAVGIVCIAGGMVASPWCVASVGAATQTTVSGSATDVNACTTNLSPALQPPGTASVSATFSSDAFPVPHNGDPILLSNTTLSITFPAQLMQTMVSAGFVKDGSVIPMEFSPVLAGSNTVEATQSYLVNSTATAHVISGVAQPLIATVNLPDTTWHPIDSSQPVFVTEQSLQDVLTLQLVSLGLTVLQKFACTPNTAPTIVTVDAVVTPPTAPGPAVAVPGDRQAILAWAAPVGTASPPITGYAVVGYIGYYPATYQTFNSTATTAVATGLTNGRQYRFKVSAMTGLGFGPQSAASNAVLIGAPTAPTSVHANAGAHQATVHWTAPASSNGAAITGYVVVFFISGVGVTSERFYSAAVTETVKPLIAGKSYTFAVAAINARGIGQRSAQSNAVTPT